MTRAICSAYSAQLSWRNKTSVPIASVPEINTSKLLRDSTWIHWVRRVGGRLSWGNIDEALAAQYIAISNNMLCTRP
jgi:hypothetical protein